MGSESFTSPLGESLAKSELEADYSLSHGINHYKRLDLNLTQISQASFGSGKIFHM